MPTPSGRDLYLDQVITGLLIGYKNHDFIADDLGRPIGVDKDTGVIPKILQSMWFRDLAQARKPGAKATESGFATDLSTLFYLREYSHAVRVLDSDRDAAGGTPFEMDMLASQLAANVVDLKQEILVATSYFASGKGWADKTVGTDFNAWDDIAQANPMLDVDKFRDEVSGKVGAEPRTLVVGQEAFTRGLKWNPALIDVVRFTSKGVLTAAQVAEILDVTLKIGKAIYTTDPEGTAEGSVSYTRIWGKHALLLSEPSETQMVAPALIKLFRKTSGAARWTRRFRYDEERYDKFEGNRKFQYKQGDTRAGVFMGSVVQ
jgi:hypothetical protein